MKFIQKHHISGTRNGQDWPGAGEPVDLPEVEAAEYLAAGLIVSTTAPVETAADVAEVETAAVAKPAKKAPAKKRA